MEDGWALLAAAEEGKKGEGKKKTPPLLLQCFLFPFFGGVVLLFVCPRSSSPFSTPSSSSVFPRGSRWGGGKLLGVGMTKSRTRQLTFSEKTSISLRLQKLSLELLKWWGIPVRSREGRKRDKSRGGEGREGAKICRLPSRVVRAKEERGKLSPTHKHTAAKTPLRLREEEEERGGPFFFPNLKQREREMRQKRRSAFAKCSVLQGFFLPFRGN